MILACADFTQVLRLAALLRNHCCGTALEDALHGLCRRINWNLTPIVSPSEGGDTVEFASVGLNMPVEQLYEDVSTAEKRIAVE